MTAGSIVAAFEPVIGKPCWLVRQGYGSSVTFEFGEPHVQVRPAREATVRTPEGERSGRRRLATVQGEWHLLAWYCDWQVVRDGAPLAHNESDRDTISYALAVLSGEVLTNVAVDPSNGATRFTFDLGGEFITRPAPLGAYTWDHVCLWSLREPSGRVLAVADDGTYSYPPPDTPTKNERWLPLLADWATHSDTSPLGGTGA